MVPTPIINNVNTSSPVEACDHGRLSELAKLVDLSVLMKLKLAKLMDLRVGTESVENEAIKWQMQEDQSLGTKLTGGMRGDEEVLPQETNVRDSRGSIPSRKSKGKKSKRWARTNGKKVMDLI